MVRTTFPKPIPLTEETLSCHLTAITACSTSPNGRTAYTYTLTLPIPYAFSPAHILVPSEYVIPTTERQFATFHKVNISRSASNTALATLGPVIAQDLAAQVYIRRILVSYKGLLFQGEVRIPRSESMIKRVEEATAVKSVEKVPDGNLERRTVSFKNAWTFVKGRRYDVEVWSLNGESLLEGRAKVVRIDVEKSEEGDWEQEVRRVVLLTQVPDDDGEVLLVGELKTDMRTGPFDEVEE